MGKLSILFFFFNDTATTEIYTLSLHDALPISHSDAAVDRGTPPRDDQGRSARRRKRAGGGSQSAPRRNPPAEGKDRKSTRLNSSHSQISYAVFCLKKKKRHDFNKLLTVYAAAL